MNTGKNNTEALENRRLAALDNDVKKQVGAELGLYVYMLLDPRNGMPFYVGKGRGFTFCFPRH